MNVTSKRRDFIPVSEPSLDDNELKYLTEGIESDWVSSDGTFVARFEESRTTNKNDWHFVLRIVAENA